LLFGLRVTGYGLFSFLLCKKYLINSQPATRNSNQVLENRFVMEDAAWWEIGGWACVFELGIDRSVLLFFIKNEAVFIFSFTN